MANENASGVAMTRSRARRIALGCIAAALIGSVAAVSADRADARKATSSERQAMLDVWDRNFPDDPAACRNTWITRVSAYRPRTGMIWANDPLRVRYDCQLGDGWAILRRPTPRSARWRVATQGSDLPPCSYITPRMARELGFEGCLQGTRVRRP
jgi:hypothetical protein